MKNYRSTVVGFAVLIVLLSAGAAQSLSGSNTVATDDIINGQVYGPDLANNAVSSAKVYDNSLIGADIRNNSLTGADINESTLNLPDDGPSSVVNHDFADATRPLRIQGESDDGTDEVLESVSFTLPRRAFIGAFLSADFTDVEDAGCPPDASEWSTARLLLEIDDRGFGLNPEEEGTASAKSDGWLDAGEHTVTLTYQVGTCIDLPSPESGSVTIEDVHLEVVALD